MKSLSHIGTHKSFVPSVGRDVFRNHAKKLDRPKKYTYATTFPICQWSRFLGRKLIRGGGRSVNRFQGTSQSCSVNVIVVSLQFVTNAVLQSYRTASEWFFLSFRWMSFNLFGENYA
ncbi:hypothetical protein NPIL_1941 [Nephila pilipes]|uniref:Uncharacterized protein n=1 Tax=Nephila pilipes TaxID=299642 RepID=A0A8X6PXT8_NEPPI|nr:hypothetical protein NPIL_1941 [Nephila pilipes]